MSKMETRNQYQTVSNPAKCATKPLKQVKLYNLNAKKIEEVKDYLWTKREDSEKIDKLEHHPTNEEFPIGTQTARRKT